MDRPAVIKRGPSGMAETVARGRRIDLAADLAVGEGLQEMLAGALEALRARSSAAARPNAEAVHRFRVGLRRLRSILSAFADALPEAERGTLGGQLRAIAQRYGRAREWDVFLVQCVAPLREAMPQAAGLAELERLARMARRRSVPGPSLQESFAAVEAAIVGSSWLRQPEVQSVEQWEMPLRDFAARLLAKRHRQLRKRLKTADLADQAGFHQLRIRVKKLRYPSELLKSLFDEGAAKKYLRRLIELQDLMGRMNDALVGEALLRELDAAPAAQPLVAGWLAHDIAAAGRQFPASARALHRVKPFWE